MDKVSNIRYLHNMENNIELIVCDNSTISYPLHNHVSVLTIGIVLKGSIVLNTNKVSSVYTENQTFVIFPYVPHSIKANDSYSLLSLCIHKKLWNQCNNDIDRIKFGIAGFLTGALGAYEISQKLIFQILDFFPSICNILTPFDMRESDSCIDMLKKQLELFPENKFSIEEMARAALTSKYHFIRRFKQTVGMTPHQFQLQNRIRKAQRLITKAETITEVALITGFCDQSHFIKQFEKYVGLTPSAFKLSDDIFDPSADHQQSAGINLANR